MAMTQQKTPFEPPVGIVPPWQTHPHLYRDRDHFADVILEASETSSFYSGIPLSRPEALAERKRQVLAELLRQYGQD